jgi:hypothetical protein
LSLAAIVGAAAAEEFLVGVETPLTGSLARVGTGMSEEIQVATDVFNRKNGKRRAFAGARAAGRPRAFRVRELKSAERWCWSSRTRAARSNSPIMCI